MTESFSKAYILHRRLFRNTSLIVDFFTYEQGFISAVAKGGRSEKSKLRHALQFFSPLLISCYGRSELLGLKSVEPNGGINLLAGKYLLSMLYVNELLTKLLHKFESHPAVFSAYEQLIQQFANQENIGQENIGQNVEENLRVFEMQLLQELGYGINFLMDHNEESGLDDAAHYAFYAEEGIRQVSAVAPNAYSGQVLRKIYQQDFKDKAALSAAKQLFRQLFGELLQHKTINSRQLFAYTVETRQ